MCEDMLSCLAIALSMLLLFKGYAWLYLQEERDYFAARHKASLEGRPQAGEPGETNE